MPKLDRAGALHWRAPVSARISYPANAHEQYVAIEEESFWFAHRNEIIVSAIRRWPPAGVILDIGGGNGFVSQALGRAGFETVVLEPSAVGCIAAIRRGLAVVEADLVGAEVREASVPAVAMFDVIEHIADDSAVMSTVAKCLEPAGMLYLTVPAHQWLWSSEDIAAGHVRRYTIASLRTLLERSGFEIEHAAHFFTILTGPVLLLRAIPSLLGLRHPSGRAPSQEHRLPKGRLGAFLARRLSVELDRFGKTRARFGTSLLVVARKTSR